MTPQALTAWSALEFRMPMLLRNVEPLSEEQMRWVPGDPGAGRNSVAWLVWHIAEVEETWVSRLVTGDPMRLPFGVQVREATPEQYPDKPRLLGYLREVRQITRGRLERATDAEFDRLVSDPDFGTLSVRDVWAGVITSFAWHGGQVALTAKLIHDTPVRTMQFKYWKK